LQNDYPVRVEYGPVQPGKLIVAAVFDSVLSPAQIQQLRTLLLADRFIDGAATAGGDAKRLKKNLQFNATHPNWRKCADLVFEAVNRCAPLVQYAMPVRLTQPLFNLYRDGMHYGKHTDAALMTTSGWPLRTDYSMTIFLSAPDEYDGGELVFSPIGQAPMRAKFAAGSAVVYPANTLHEVMPVTRGDRFAVVMWMQSALPNEAERNVIQELDRVRALLDAKDIAEANEHLRLAREDLVRMFARP
jgi:PKHD-type hydroxylase